MQVKYLNLVSSIRDPEPHDWVICFCNSNQVLLLEVVEQVPPELHAVFFQNVRNFAKSGIIMSWAGNQMSGDAEAQMQSDFELQSALGLIFEIIQGLYLPDFKIDTEATQHLRFQC